MNKIVLLSMLKKGKLKLGAQDIIERIDSRDRVGESLPSKLQNIEYIEIVPHIPQIEANE